MLLRNPIYRDWSSLLMEANLRLKVDLSNVSFVDLMVYYDRTNVAQFSTYATAVKLWKHRYGDQFFVGFYDDIARDPQEFYVTLCAHCGLDPEAVKNWRDRVKKVVFKGPDLALPAQMQEFLSKKYEPMIRELEQLLSRDLSDWLSPDPAAK